jgi:hypothetical protein
MLGHFSQGNENLCSQENLCRNVYSSFIRNTPNLETTQLSFNKQRVKQSPERSWCEKVLEQKEE